MGSKLLDGDVGSLSPTLGLGPNIGFKFILGNESGPLRLGAASDTRTIRAAVAQTSPPSGGGGRDVFIPRQPARNER